LKTISRDELHHLGFARYGYQYLQAARLVQQEKNEEFPVWPAYYNLSLGIELTVKSYLIFEGGDRSLLKKCSHNLLFAFNEAEKRGLEKIFTMSEYRKSVIQMLTNLAAGDVLRYFESGWKNPPAWTPSFTLGIQLLNVVAKHVGSRESFKI
jgi:hypothetical protein